MIFEAINFSVSMIYPLIVSLAISGILVLTKNLHGWFSLDTHEGAQKFHTLPTPRIGGVALFGAVITGLYTTSRETSGLLGLMIVAGLPAFIFGLLEDITKRVSVRKRLLATMFSGLLCSLFTGYHIDYIGISYVDYMFTFVPFSILFTAFAVGGVVNSINIIDGFNGLAGIVLVICFGMFGVIAWQIGDGQILELCILMSLSVCGFLFLNFPLGKIFMGDGGAYFIGFMLAWVAVMLPMRNPEVSPWTSLIVCSYPIIETLFSIWRKSFRNGHHPGQPDRVHFHMLIFQRVSRAIFFGRRTSFINGMTSIFIFPFALFCALPGFLFYSSTTLLFISFFAGSFLYYLIYLRLTQFSWCLMSANMKKAIVKNKSNHVCLNALL
jgi:UDP-N-acetylmuramyl pentapeptide phosphotransferase/UDP-N-acetylglucosamine-1-phosphate transferase